MDAVFSLNVAPGERYLSSNLVVLLTAGASVGVLVSLGNKGIHGKGEFSLVYKSMELDFGSFIT